MRSNPHPTLGRGARKASPVASNLMLAALAALFALAACSGSRTTVHNPAANAWPSAADQLDFFAALETQPIVTNADAVHALLLFDHAADNEIGSWETERAAAVRRGWLDESAQVNPHESARVGMVAGAIARISRLDLGAAGLFIDDSAGSSFVQEAAATRRARRLGLLPRRSSEQTLTGPELLTLLRRAEAYESFAPSADDANQ